MARRRPEGAVGKKPAEAPVRVVAIGSSAGGLEALVALLGSLPQTGGSAYVLAQHLAPDHESQLVPLLSRATHLPVSVALHGAPMVPGTISVAAPGTDLRVRAGRLEVIDPGDAPGPHPSIDVLMTSVADDCGDRAVAIILSGTGRDGSAGSKAVQAAGGLTLVQQPDTAQFDEMPRAAIEAGHVDLVLAPHEMGAVLERPGLVPDRAEPASGAPDHHRGEHDGQDLVGRHGETLDLTDAEQQPEQLERVGGISPTDVARVLAALRDSCGIDFSEYKAATLERQLARRLAIVESPDVTSYVSLVASGGVESQALERALLVNVTSFFRDAETWTALLEVLRERWGGRDPSVPIRVWVPGCASGEEAYTVAMVVAEAIGSWGDLSLRLKVFATDLSDEGLATARAGRYSDADVQSIPAELRARWLRRTGSGWEVVPAMRDALVFAHHHVSQDPPFPRLDLITLRNTLIYFRAPMQERVLRLCHFALAPAGLLVLGDSERPYDRAGLLLPVDEAHRIYERALGVATLPQAGRGPALAVAPPSEARPPVTDTQAILRTALIEQFVAASLVVDADDDVVEVIGDVTRWCWVAPGQPSTHVVALVREELRLPVRGLLVQVRHSGADSAERDVTTADGITRVTVRPLNDVSPGWALVSFGTPATSAPAATATPGDERVDAMAQELEHTRAALQGSIEDLSASNEELRVLNEELQATTEELQATNEELQATNEELTTLNEEMVIRTAQLESANTVLENVQASLTSGMVVVDSDLRIVRFTPLAVRLFPLIQADIGRPLSDVTPTAPVVGLDRHLRQSAESGARSILEVAGQHADFLVQVQPFLRSDGAPSGAIIVITEITELAQARREARRAVTDMTALTGAVRETLWQRLASGKLAFVNVAVEELFGLSRDRVLADPGLLRAAVHPDDREAVALAEASAVGRWDLQYRIVRPDGAVRWVAESAISLPGTPERPEPVTVGSVSDITEQHRWEQAARRHGDVFEALFEMDYLGLVSLDDDDRIVRANDAFAEVSGYETAALVGMPFARLVEDFRDPPEVSAAVGRGPLSTVEQHRLVASGGAVRWVAMEVDPVASSSGSPERAVVLVHDLTRLRRLSGELATQMRFDQQTGALTRAHFRDRVSEELSRARRTGRRLGVLWVDLDDFKDVNDRHGHRAGDLVLARVAERLTGAARRQDPVGRLGGDEFAVLVTDVTRDEDVEAVAGRVLSALREPIVTEEGQLFVSGSVGIAVGPADGEDADSLLHSADTAMYAGKSAGRDRVTYFSTAMNLAATDRAQARQSFSAAVREHAFVMHYQPIVDVRTGALTSAEALVRWQRDGEIVPAAKFISTAQDTGQLALLGAIVRELVTADLTRLDASPARGLAVAMNISPDELDERDLVGFLATWNPPGGYERLIVEVTESTLMSSEQRTTEALALLRRLGATIAVDDFGTGFSNLALLERLGPSVLKIDRSLLTMSGAPSRAEAILRAAVQIGHALESEVIVEGVETIEQLSYATRLGADHVQGYLIARPMPLDDLIAWTPPDLTELTGPTP